MLFKIIITAILLTPLTLVAQNPYDQYPSHTYRIIREAAPIGGQFRLIRIPTPHGRSVNELQTIMDMQFEKFLSGQVDEHWWTRGSRFLNTGPADQAMLDLVDSHPLPHGLYFMYDNNPPFRLGNTYNNERLWIAKRITTAEDFSDMYRVGNAIDSPPIVIDVDPNSARGFNMSDYVQSSASDQPLGYLEPRDREIFVFRNTQEFRTHLNDIDDPQVNFRELNYKNPTSTLLTNLDMPHYYPGKFVNPRTISLNSRSARFFSGVRSLSGKAISGMKTGSIRFGSRMHSALKASQSAGFGIVMTGLGMTLWDIEQQYPGLNNPAVTGLTYYLRYSMEPWALFNPRYHNAAGMAGLRQATMSSLLHTKFLDPDPERRKEADESLKLAHQTGILKVPGEPCPHHAPSKLLASIQKQIDDEKKEKKRKFDHWMTHEMPILAAKIAKEAHQARAVREKKFGTMTIFPKGSLEKLSNGNTRIKNLGKNKMFNLMFPKSKHCEY